MKLQGKAEGADNPSTHTTVEKINQALRAVKYLRTAKFSAGLVQWLKEIHGIDAVVKEEAFPGSGPERREEFLDPRATAKKYKDKDLKELVHYYRTEHNKGVIHTGQVEALRDGLTMLGCNG